jgi:hypothetical protein
MNPDPHAVRDLARVVAKAAPMLPPHVAVELWDGVAEVLNGPEAEAARFAALALRQGTQAQSNFLHLLQEGGAN